MADQQLRIYVQGALAQGKPKEDIYKELLGQGWTIDAIQDAFVVQSSTVTVAVPKQEDTSKRTISIIVTIGAILVGAGVFSFIASNWQDMGRLLKLMIILVSMLISYGAGWYLKEKMHLVKTGEALILLGAIIYGSGIFLVAQMFHVRANWPDGFILWMIGTIAMAFATESYPLLYLALPLGAAALIGHPFGMFGGFGYN
ncbi:MAG: DUF2157 domain-containing protein, partial [Patescibacteria group bacterium]